MPQELSVRELWDSVRSGKHTFRANDTTGLTGVARSYLEHAIAPGARRSSAVRLLMHGEIKLQNRWLPFKAEEVIVWGRGFIWSAEVRMFGTTIRGSDRLLDGEGSMRWRLLGILPVMSASGSDISRSASGRVAGEVVWLPSVLCGEDVAWTEGDPTHLKARFTAHEEEAEVELVIDARGRLQTVKLPRWGNPDETGFRYADFGAIVEEERTFEGYTIPSQLRVGWHLGTERFESQGEFFRVTIDEATYR